MENISADGEEPSLVALAETIESNSIFDRGGAGHFRLPCAANLPTAMHNEQVCSINDYLPICNELLFDIGMQLREQRGRSLSLVCFHSDEADVMPPHDTDLCRANTFLRWLLRTHVCIAGIDIQFKWAKAHSLAVLEELPEHCRLKKLIVQFPPVDTTEKHVATLIPRLRYLEELQLFIPSYTDIALSRITDAVLAAVSTLLRTTTCLTSLHFRAIFDHGHPLKTLIDALTANSTLKSLELWTNWTTDGQPGCLGEFMRSNRSLTKLTLYDANLDRAGLSLDEALVSNCTLSTLEIVKVWSGERTVNFLTRILSECAAIKKVSLLEVHHWYDYVTQATTTRCAEALAENKTLEELTLPYHLWRPNHWFAFVALLPKNKRLKKLKVSHHFHGIYETFPPLLEALAQTNSLARVTFGTYEHGLSAVDLMHYEAFSSLVIDGDVSVQVSALQRLLQLDHFTSLSLELCEADQRWFSSLAKYVRATTVLRELRLAVSSPVDAAPLSCWTLLFDSISANTSVADLSISCSDNLMCNERLATTIGLSRYITRVSYKMSRERGDPTSFILPLSEAIADNYNLLEVHLSSGQVGVEARRGLFTIRETTRRNSSLVECAAGFNQTTPPDWYTANALEKVSRHPALMRELAEMEGIAACEVARMIRSRLRSVEDLHDFMRVTGVVKRCVTCYPPADGCSVQLQDLNDDCWRLLRRYLSFDDVKRFAAGKPDDSTPSRTTLS